MKKLLVLMLVLVCAGWASAGLSLEVVDNQVAINLDAGSLGLMSYVLEVGIDAGTFDSGAADINPSGHVWMLAPRVDDDLPQLFSVLAADIFMCGCTGLAAPAQVLTGLTVKDATNYTVTLTSKDATWADTTNSLGVLDTVTVPEPMSMVLLGLGGLLLRCRK